jgi:hypothetical protein
MFQAELLELGEADLQNTARRLKAQAMRLWDGGYNLG